MSAPNFWKTFGETLTLSAESRGVIAYCPWLMLLIFGIGLIAGFLAISLGATFVKADTVAALSAMMVAAGFLGAVSVGCMNQIFTTLGDDKFSDYLSSAGAFDQFLAWPQIVYLIQMSYFTLCAISILIVCISESDELRILILSVMAIGTIYLANKTWQLIDLLRILAWHRQDYARQLAAISAEP